MPENLACGGQVTAGTQGFISPRRRVTNTPPLHDRPGVGISTPVGITLISQFAVRSIEPDAATVKISRQPHNCFPPVNIYF